MSWLSSIRSSSSCGKAAPRQGMVPVRLFAVKNMLCREGNCPGPAHSTGSGEEKALLWRSREVSRSRPLRAAGRAPVALTPQLSQSSLLQRKIVEGLLEKARCLYIRGRRCRGRRCRGRRCQHPASHSQRRDTALLIAGDASPAGAHRDGGVPPSDPVCSSEGWPVSDVVPELQEYRHCTARGRRVGG